MPNTLSTGLSLKFLSSSFFLKNSLDLFLYVCLSVVPAWVYVYRMCAWYLWNSEENMRSFGTERWSWAALWESNHGFLQEQWCSTQWAISVVSYLYYVDVVWAGETLQGSKYRIHLIYFLLINLYFNWDRSLYLSLSWSLTLISCLPHAGFTGFVWLCLSRGRVLHCSPGWLGTRYNPGWEMVQQVPGLEARNWQRL